MVATLGLPRDVADGIGETAMAARDPIAEPLSSPSGVPLTALTWADVRGRVAAQETHLLATSGQGGRPHVVPVLGV
ncbi:hypothetical protein GCM10009727_45130 [Actinomadura napierensis]|uniref:Pyridoxamine 5'-phosphate oxidase family protein n=1 Tax=Actinomadura napierensis TaxID=267854 RepID=A0ABN2ZNG6_9ACTN